MLTCRADVVRGALVAALGARGVPLPDATDVADALITATRRGVHTHGLRLAPTYLAELDGGRARAEPTWTWTQPRPAFAHLGAGGALGVVAGLRAARRAASLAETYGVGAVAVADSNHFGPASAFTLPLARAGLVGLAFSNADVLMTAPGGRTPTLGTNPLSIAAPGADDEIFCLDMATSQVAWSRIRAEHAANGTLPPGWALDAEGRDCAAPGAGPPAVACTLGGYKGAGLALAIELLCAGLAGSCFGNAMSHLYAPPWDTPRDVAHLILAIRPPDPAFRARVSAYLAWYRAQPREDGQPTLVPGDRERDSAAGSSRVPVEPAVAEALGL